MSSDINLMNLLMVMNCVRYINQELGTKILVNQDGKILDGSDFTASSGEEVTIEQIKNCVLQYGEGMSKMFEVLGDVVVDSATAGIANEMTGTDPNITVIIS